THCATARPPADSMAVTVSFALSRLMSATTTAAPSAAMRCAVARPIPEPEPVTIATFPSSTPTIPPVMPDSAGVERHRHVRDAAAGNELAAVGAHEHAPGRRERRPIGHRRLDVRIAADHVTRRVPAVVDGVLV